VLGLGYLTRPLTLALAAGLLLGVVLATRARGRLLGPLAALALSLALCVVPISLYSLATRGSLSYMGQAWYSIMEDNDIIFNATLRPLPSPAEFVAANRDAVFVAIIRKIRLYVNLVFLDGRWLLPLLPASLTLVPALVRGRVPRAVWPVLSLTGTNFLLYGLSWSLYARRYQVLTLLLLLPLMVDGLVRLGLPRVRLRRGPPLSALQLAVALVVLFWLQTFIQQYGGTFQEAGGGELVGTRTYQGLRWTGTPGWMQDRDLPRLLDWVGANTAGQDIVAHPSPWIVTFFTARPSALLPRRLDAETFRRFLVEYRVAYVLLRNDDVYWRRYGDDLLELAGGSVTAVGNYRVFDTRALWR
jgi:hypothetical protein